MATLNKKGKRKMYEERVSIAKHAIATFCIIILTLIIEILLIRTLPAFNTFEGSLLLLKDLLIQSALLSLAGLFFLLVFAFFTAESKYVWVIHYFFIPLICVAAFLNQMGNALGVDVMYTTYMNKAGINWLKVRLMCGWSIVFIFILVALLFLSDPRISFEEGEDGKKHLYARSKLLGILRLAFKEEKWGETADAAIIEKGREEGRYYSIRSGHFNDKIRVFSWNFAIWALVKFAIGFTIALMIADSFALRFMLIQNYLNQTGMSWFDGILKLLGIGWSRITGQVQVAASFPVSEAFVFELLQFFYPLILYFCILWGIRLFLAIIGEAYIYYSEGGGKLPTSRILSNIFLLIVLFFVPWIATIPKTVFEASTPYYVWTGLFFFAFFIALALFFRIYKPSYLSQPFEKIMDWVTSGRTIQRGIALILGIALLIAGLFSPIIYSKAFIEPFMQGRWHQYVWNPAYVPTIAYTRWAYEVDEIERVNSSLITTPSREVLKNVRIFTLDAARLYMKPYVGVNWMSIDKTDIDIIYLNGSEYWVALLTLVRPPYPGDVDVWRAEHMLLTHSERILAIDVATTQLKDVSELFNLKETPQLYYGEGGLWKEVDEIYLDIPGFPETHLSDYEGPAGYNDEPDYIYKDFWRFYHFGMMWRFDFASGDYGDIKALVKRDLKERVSEILLPGMQVEPDGYPVIDDKGNIYMLYWLWVTWDTPHDFGDYPEHEYNQIYRKFAIVLVNLKNGEISGYLMNRRNDYVLSFYLSFYSQWDKPVPEWLKSQLRYPEEFIEKQIDVYNWYWQDDPQEWQRNKFYELTMADGNIIEDVRYIMMPINNTLKWCAVRLVEWYKGTTRNLAGMYVAPCEEETGKLYFVDFEGKTIIGPSIALSTVKSNPQLAKIPAFAQGKWIEGNILFYSMGNELYYVIPWYRQEANMLLPQMVAIVNAFTQQMGFYIIQNPKDPNEVLMAATYAFQNMGVELVEKPEQFELNGTLLNIFHYVKEGNSRWIIELKLENGTSVQVLAKAEMLAESDIAKISQMEPGDWISLRVDKSMEVLEVLAIGQKTP